MKRVLIFLLLFMQFSAFAQIGGSSVFEFVDLPSSARENAFCGTVVSTTQTDLSFALKNPSLLDSSYANQIVGSWGLLHLQETGIGYGTIACAYSLPCGISLDGGVHFVNYGVFDGYDEDGQKTGSFFCKEFEIIFGGSYQLIDNLSVGINLKPILSYYESYSSYGLLFDIATTYSLENSAFSLALRNVGWQLKAYTQTHHEDVPFSLDVAYSQQLQHAPFRFNITYNDIQKFNIYEEESSSSNSSNNYDEDEEREFVTYGKMFLKHIGISGELLLGKHLAVMVGYSYRKSQELSFGSSTKGVGFGVGFGLNFSRFQLSYGWSKQQVAGGRSVITLGFNAQTIYSVCKNSIQKHKTSNNDNCN